MQIAIVGLGLMGRPMAHTLQRAGFRVAGWNRSALDPALSAGIDLLPDLASVATWPNLLLMLADSAATDAVLAQLEPHLHAGQLLIDMGSSDPSHSRQHAERLAARGILWLDAPVSGGPEGAAQGSLAIMAGGSAEAFGRAEALFAALGRATHVGAAGAGHTTKVVNQLIVGLTIEAVAEALRLAEGAGVDPALVQVALRGGFADSKILQIHGSRMIARNYQPGGKVKTQLKDLHLAQALAAAAGLHLPHLASAIERYTALVNLGHGDLDHSAVDLLLGVE